MTDELLNQLQELTQSANLTPSVESAIHNLMMSAYRKGCSEGLEEGYTKGFKVGHDAGWELNDEVSRRGL